jgi:hypothetical protein
MRLDRVRAAEIIREQAARLKSDKGAPQWIIKVERLSQLCETGISKTHIAFLGTAMLAKTLDLRADLFAIKPTHARDNAKAFSARTLSHSVLVPLAAELGINLGVTGREPLNNQPYFRMERLDVGTPVHAGGRAAFDYMLSLVRELQELRSQDQALGALRAFIGVRMGYVSIRRGAQCRLSAERVPVLGLHGVEDTVGSERFDRLDESEAAMEAEPFSGVAVPLDVEAVGADPVEASERRVELLAEIFREAGAVALDEAILGAMPFAEDIDGIVELRRPD